jgi:RHS repeat-associated protein
VGNNKTHQEMINSKTFVYYGIHKSTLKKKIFLYLVIQLLFVGALCAQNTPPGDSLKTDTVKKDTIVLLKSTVVPQRAIEIRQDTVSADEVKGTKSPGSKNKSSQTQTSSVTAPVDAGRTMGNLDVSASGAATYAIPISVPPGIAGVAPQVALTYSSQAGNGLAGYGWNISGVSTISRIPATRFHDNIIGRVNIDMNDRYALDGQRLILKSGTYGADGSEYQTENYSNVRVIARGTSSLNNGPNTFDVYYPDGSHAVYGEQYGSRSPTDFAIDYIDNPQGIRINYTYVPSNNTIAISSISYGAKGSGTPINTINFVYQDRQRKEQAYIGTYSFYRDKILSEINVVANGSGYRSYILTSEQVPGLKYERITSVQELNGDRSKSFEPVNFNYSATSSFISLRALNNFSPNGIQSTSHKILTSDFNGNGKMDLILYPNSKTEAYIYFDPKDANSLHQFTQISTGPFEDIFAVNELSYDNTLHAGQGFTLVKQPDASTINFELYQVGTTSAVTKDTATRQWSNVPKMPDYYSECTNTTKQGDKIPREFLSGDFNGDGLTDVIAVNKSYSYVTYETSITDPDDPNVTKCVKQYDNESTPTVYFINLDRRVTSNYVNTAGTLLLSHTGSDHLYTADFNGDGRTDIIQVAAGVMYVYGLTNENQLVLLCQKSDSRITTTYPALLGDYNGDGKADLIFPTAETAPNNNVFAFFMSTGTDFVKIEQTLPFANTGMGWDNTTLTQPFIIANDMNGDGKTDLILCTTYTYNTTNIGRARVEIYNNQGPASVTTGPVFELSAVKDDSNLHLNHYPIPLFFTNEEPNFSLEFGLYSNDALTLFNHEKNIKTESQVSYIEQDGVLEYIDYSSLPITSSYQLAKRQLYPYVDIEAAPGLMLVNKLRRYFNNSEIQQTFSYAAGVSNTEGLGFLGFSQLTRSNWHAYNGDVNRIFTTSFNDPMLRGAPVKVFTSKNGVSASSTANNVPGVLPDKTLSAPPSPATQTVEASNSITMTDGFVADGNNGTFIAKITDPASGINDSATISDYITRTDYTYNTQLLTNKVFINTPTSVTTKDLLNKTNTLSTYAYDSYYNVTSEFSNLSGAGTKTTDIAYENNPSGGYVGRPLTKKVTASSGGDTFSTEEQYTYTGFLPTQIKKKGNGTPFITETHTYDTYGNILTNTLTTSAGSRTTSMQYDASGRFVTKSTNLEGLETNMTYHTGTGNLLTKTNPYSQTTNYDYDSWGRLAQTTDFLGFTSNRTYQASGSDIVISETDADGQSKITTVNAIGKTVSVAAKDVLGQMISKESRYDIYDRPVNESEPSTGTPNQWNETEYDEYGRVKKITAFTGKITTIDHNGLITTVNDGTKSVTTTKNGLGQVISTQDPGGTINNAYFANGNLKSADYAGSSQTIEQDGWGRKTKLTDPSAGIYTYAYNEFGETLTETTPKGSTTYSYDGNGKLQTKQITGTGSTPTNMAYSYTYDGTTKMLTGTNLTNADGNNIIYTYTYDSNKRLASSVEDNTYAKFTKTLTYDTYGHIATETNEAKNKGNNLTVSKTVQNNYQYGQLKSITDYNTGISILSVSEINARGQVTTALLGNNLKETNTYDQYGLPQQFKTEKVSGTPTTLMTLSYTYDVARDNLTSRGNTAFSTAWNETFTYDSQDRLTSFTDNNGTQGMTYDGRGRITNNDRLGNYVYTGNSYQQTKITGLTAFANYHYQNHQLQNIEYTAFKQPVEIAEVGKDIITFQYNGDLQRSHMYYGNVNVDKFTRPYRRHYSEDGSMEITEDIVNAKTSFVFYLGGDAYTAPAIWKNEQTSTNTTDGLYYLHRDQLGSILLITNISGAVKEKRQFDAWGNIVKLEDGNGNALTTFAILDRGYTGHEHLLSVGLINMNGRLYDPLLHRFLSPDNFLQDPSNTQNFNRYGYVLNNPLKYNDASGEILPFIAIVIGAAVLGGTANVAMNWKNIHNFKDGLFYFGVGAAVGGGAVVGAAAFAPVIGTGAISGAIFGAAGGGFAGFANTKYAGGSWGTALKSAGWGALIGGVTGGLVSGAISSFRGNNFWTGAPKGAVGPSFRLRDVERITTKDFWKYGYNPKVIPSNEGKIAAGTAEMTAEQPPGDWRNFSATARKLQSVYDQHGDAFGFSGNFKANEEAFSSALKNHILNSETQQISGFYRGIPAYNYFNPTNNLWLATDKAGNLLSGWKLYPSQVISLLENGYVK